MKDLNSLISKIYEWCDSHSILMLPGTVETKRILVDWNSLEDEDVFKFLAIAKKNDVNHIILLKSIFAIEEEVNIEKVENISDLEKKKKAKEIYKNLKNKNGEVDFLEISWISTKGDGVVYQYSIHDDDISLLLEEMEEFENVSEKTINLKIKDLAKKVASHADFYSSRYDSQKLRSILGEILEAEGSLEVVDFKSEITIFQEAIQYFGQYLLSKKEKEIHLKVHELKIQGLSKIAIRSKLNLSESALNKFWHQELK